MHTEIINNVQITVGDQQCIVPLDGWDVATNVLDMIAEYTKCIGVRKVIAIKMVREHTGCSLREAKLMTEAYFEPRFLPYAEQDAHTFHGDRGWHKYD